MHTVESLRRPRTTLAFVLALGIPGIARPSPSSIDLTVTSGDVKLAATLVLPEGSAPPPGVVLMGGSGPSTRADLRPMADQLVTRGWAVLTYDKRGCGESGGDWTATSLSQLADDAAAGLTTLAARPEVDARRLGLWGNSNSGWVGPIAASRTKAAAFLVVFTGGGATPRAVEEFGYAKRLARAQLSGEQVAEARKALDAYFRYLDTGAGLEDLKAALAAPANRPWADALGLARVLPGEQGRRAWEWVATYDPAADIARLRIPTLVMLAGRDEDAPLEKAVAGWTSGLAAAGDPRSRVVVVPTASHAMTAGGHHPHAPGGPTFAAGVFDEVTAWERGLKTPP